MTGGAFRPQPRATRPPTPHREGLWENSPTTWTDVKEKCVNDFVAAWSKVMNLDRFELPAAAKSAVN